MYQSLYFTFYFISLGMDFRPFLQLHELQDHQNHGCVSQLELILPYDNDRLPTIACLPA